MNSLFSHISPEIDIRECQIEIEILARLSVEIVVRGKGGALPKEMTFASRGNQMIRITGLNNVSFGRKTIGSGANYRLRIKSDCCLYHFARVPEPGTHAALAGRSPRQRASF